MVAKPVEILLVENSEGDVELIEEVFEEAKTRDKIHRRLLARSYKVTTKIRST